jgi:hypothetical protein
VLVHGTFVRASRRVSQGVGPRGVGAAVEQALGVAATRRPALAHAYARK